jgi:hypothetical protein
MDDNSCWTTARRELLDWLKRNAPSLAELYEGAVELLHRHPLPGWTRFVSHAVREIRNRLPDVILGLTRGPRLDYTKRLNAISEAWRNAGLHEHSIPSVEEFHSPPSAENPSKPIEIPTEIHRLINDLIVEHLKVLETRAEVAGRFIEACASENKSLRETPQPVVRHWMTITEWFVHRAHDSGETDADFNVQEFCRKFELFESVLGSLIRAFFASLDELDEILAASDVIQVDRAVSLLARTGHYRYFFDKLNDPRWISPLAEKGFFRHPPALIPVEGGQYVHIPQWPESRFLARIIRSASEQEQEQLADIACAIPETENASVHQDLAEIALAVPPRLAVRLVPRAKKWVDKFTFFLVPLKLGELAVHLARGGYFKEARDLVRHLLAILPDPRKGKADQAPEHYIPNPRGVPIATEKKTTIFTGTDVQTASRI